MVSMASIFLKEYFPLWTDDNYHGQGSESSWHFSHEHLAFLF